MLVFQMEDFILATTDELWATIYKKRKRCRENPLSWYDRAAKVNQPEAKPFDYHYWQDAEVKEIFRQMVDYIAEVIA